jgi:transposase-like protein
VAAARSRFRPPFCPNPDCDSHADPAAWRFKKKGFHWSAAAGGHVQRYRCQRCGRNFSDQTFSPTYWLRTPRVLRGLFFRILACSALRQIAAELGVCHATVQRQVERLGRHCLLLHERLRPREGPREPVVLDGLRSFEAAQYWPFDLNLLVGRSHFVYAFNDAELRRSGTMTPGQHTKRQRLERRFGRPAPQATRAAVEELMGRVVPPGAAVTVHSDLHAAYAEAFRRLGDRAIAHHCTSSRAVRTPRNRLFPANLADLLVRHTGANHKHETIAFSKRRQGALYRMAIFTVWRNYVKSTSERRRDEPPGVRIGAIPRRLALADLLRERLFPWRAQLLGWLAECYYGRIPTRCLPRLRSHRLRYAV